MADHSESIKDSLKLYKPGNSIAFWHRESNAVRLLQCCMPPEEAILMLVSMIWQLNIPPHIVLQVHAVVMDKIKNGDVQAINVNMNTIEKAVNDLINEMNIKKQN